MKRYSDEGPSNRPHLASEIAPASDDEGLEEVDESEASQSLEEYTGLEEVVESKEPWSSVEGPRLEEVEIATEEIFSDDEALFEDVPSVPHPTKASMNSFKPSKPRPLNLLDDFEIVGGIPAVVIESEKNKEDFDGYVFSSDGSRMALRCIQGNVKVYDVFDSFSFVGDYKFDNPIKFLDFWNLQNYMLIVVTWDRKVYLVSIPHMRIVGQDTVQHKDVDDKLVIEQEFNVPHPDNRFSVRSLEVAHNGITIWIVERELCLDRAMLLTSFSESEGVKQVRICGGFNTWPKSLHLSISTGAIAAVRVDKEHGTLKTKLFEDIDFATGESNVDPYELDGNCVYLSKDGEELALWRIDENGMHHLDVYQYQWNDGEDETALRLCCSVGLSFDLMDVLIEPLNRFKTPFKKATEIMDEMFPLLGLIAIKSVGVNLIVIDSSNGKIVKEVDLTFEKVELNDPSDVSIRISNNTKWISVCFLKSRTIGLFSFASASLIWTYRLDPIPRNCLMQGSSQFDSLSRILVVASIGSLIALYPHCLANKDETAIVEEPYMFLSNFEMHVPISKIPYQKISKTFMFCICDNFYQRGFLDVASSFTSPRVTIMFSLQNEVHIFLLSSFEDVFSKRFKEWVYKRDIICRPDFCTKDTIVKDWKIDDPNAAHVFFCPSQENKGRNHIAIFYIAEGINVVFVEERNLEDKVLVSFDERANYWLGLSQSKDGTSMTCLGKESVWVLNLNQSTIVKKVQYQSDLVEWIKSFRFSCFHCFCGHFLELLIRKKRLTKR